MAKLTMTCRTKRVMSEFVYADVLAAVRHVIFWWDEDEKAGGTLGRMTPMAARPGCVERTRRKVEEEGEASSAIVEVERACERKSAYWEGWEARRLSSCGPRGVHVSGGEADVYGGGMAESSSDGGRGSRRRLGFVVVVVSWMVHRQCVRDGMAVVGARRVDRARRGGNVLESMMCVWWDWMLVTVDEYLPNAEDVVVSTPAPGIKTLLL
jgi:hypothetical protein